MTEGMKLSIEAIWYTTAEEGGEWAKGRAARFGQGIGDGGWRSQGERSRAVPLRPRGRRSAHGAAWCRTVEPEHVHDIVRDAEHVHVPPLHDHEVDRARQHLRAGAAAGGEVRVGV